MWRCNNCHTEFDEPEEVRTTYESYYGVSDMFENSHSLTLAVCPCCGDDDFDKVEDEE